MPLTVEELEVKVNTLTAQLKESREENAERRVKAKDDAKAIETLTREKDEVARTLEDTNGKLKKPSELQADYDKKVAELRDLKYRTAFKEIASELKVKPKASDDLWNSLGIKADKDDPDKDVIRKAVEDKKESADYYFDLDSTPPGDDNTKPPAKSLIGNNRGGPAPKKFVVTVDQRRDAKWMSENRGRLAEAAKDGTLDYQ